MGVVRTWREGGECRYPEETRTTRRERASDGPESGQA